MSARVFAILNAVGCLCLSAFIFVQWFSGNAVEKELTGARRSLRDEQNAHFETHERATRLEADVAGFKASLDSLQASAVESEKALAERVKEAEAMQATLIQNSAQAKVYEEAIKARDEALKIRDERLKELNEALVATRKRLDEAIVRLKEAGAR
jgi:DNA repair exonuclease SbcCD ATPase subunit